MGRIPSAAFSVVLAVAALGFTAGLARPGQAERERHLADLLADERLDVVFHSSGCFHSDEYQFSFSRYPAEVVVSADAEAASVGLSMDELLGLDRLFEFYRSSPGSGCTTQDRITLSWFVAGEVVATETFVDGSCSVRQVEDLADLPSDRLDRYVKDVVSLRSLISRADLGS